MSKPRKKPGNPDFRHRSSVSAPKSEAIEARLFELLSPGTLTTFKGVIAVWYDTNPNCNETTWWEALLRRLPIGGLIIVDMGCRNRFTTAFGTNFRGNGFPQFVFC